MKTTPGRAGKLLFPTSAFVQVYFEAVANAFDAKASEVTINITEAPLAIAITDNGVGFTDERYARFADLLEPDDEFHKGIGRLVYLNYFSSVRVESSFGNKRRSFLFTPESTSPHHTEEAPEPVPQRTTLTFTGYHRDRRPSDDDLQPDNLRAKILEQFLFLLHNKRKGGHAFTINLTLTPKKATMALFSTQLTDGDVPRLQCQPVQHALDAFGTPINMYYDIRSMVGGKLMTAACVDERTIPIPALRGTPLLKSAALPPNHSATFLFESDLFAGKVDNARQRLVLPDTISIADLHRVLRRAMAPVLDEHISAIPKANAAIKQHFDEKYPHLTDYFDEETVGLIDRDDALATAQGVFFGKQKAVLECETLDDATFKTSLEVSARTLMEYMLYRQLIIKRLSTTKPEDREAVIHNLIVPQRSILHAETMLDGLYTNNAWVLDDKFMSYRTILSDASLQEVIAAIAPEEHEQDEGKPDISMIFSAEPTETAGVDVVVVELKRRDAGLKENHYAIGQLLQRAMRLAEYMHAIQRIWYFAVVDVDDAMAKLLRADSYTPLFSRGPHVYYREYAVERDDKVKVPTPICVLSFDSIIKDAEARHDTFLAVLRSAFRQARTAPEKG